MELVHVYGQTQVGQNGLRDRSPMGDMIHNADGQWKVT